ncbi:MAG TPA: hypothetical protein VGK24_09575 [Candidatus Angelobacter sp.]|jgi:hypothetical protein
MTKLFDSVERISWKPILERIALLEPDTCAEFPELKVSNSTLNRMRASVSANRESLRGRVRVTVIDGVIRVWKLGKEESIQSVGFKALPPSAETIKSEVEPVNIGGHCAERACPRPPGPSGMCSYHAFWSRQNSSFAGSSLSGRNIDGA